MFISGTACVRLSHGEQVLQRDLGVLGVLYSNPGASYVTTWRIVEVEGCGYVHQGTQAQNREGAVLTPANLKFEISRV